MIAQLAPAPGWAEWGEGRREVRGGDKNSTREIRSGPGAEIGADKGAEVMPSVRLQLPDVQLALTL